VEKEGFDLCGEFQLGVLQLIESLAPLRELASLLIRCLSNMIVMDSTIMTSDLCMHLTFHFLSEYSSHPETLVLAETITPATIPPDQWTQISLPWTQKVVELLALATQKPKGHAISRVFPARNLLR
jgi:hypothetical protein